MTGSRMDPECIVLCEAINLLPGLHTTGSCYGHGDLPYWIFLVADAQENLLPLLYYTSACHCGCYDWRVIAYTDCTMDYTRYLLEGPAGETAYKEAEKIASLLIDYIREVKV